MAKDYAWFQANKEHILKITEQAFINAFRQISTEDEEVFQTLAWIDYESISTAFVNARIRFLKEQDMHQERKGVSIVTGKQIGRAHV